MTTDEPNPSPAASEQDGEDGPQGVFGNLPRTRPGARSPRRDRATGRRAAGPAKAQAGAKTPPGPQRAPRPPRDPAPEAEAPPASQAEGGGIEDVAWAGVAAAAEAATIGVRLATRALDAMRDAVDRR